MVYTRFLYQMIFMSFNSNTTGVTSEAGTANTSGGPEYTPSFSGVYVAQSISLCVLLCGSMFVIVSFSLPLHCLSILYLRLLVTPLVFSHICNDLQANLIDKSAKSNY